MSVESVANRVATDATRRLRQPKDADEPSQIVAYPYATCVELVVEEDAECEGCNLGTRRHGAVTWIDERGEEAGAWSHQHGCGAWNTPHSELVHLTDPENDRRIEEQLTAAADGLLEQLEEEHKAQRRAAARRRRLENAKADLTTKWIDQFTDLYGPVDEYEVMRCARDFADKYWRGKAPLPDIDPDDPRQAEVWRRVRDRLS